MATPHDPSDRRARRPRGDRGQLPRAISDASSHSASDSDRIARATRRASSPSSRPTPTATARREVGLALEEAGAAMLACADIEEGIVLREAGVRDPDPRLRRAGRQRSRRRVRARPDADDLDAVGAARALAGGGAPGDAASIGSRCHLKIDTGMNRLGFRHDNLARTLPASPRARTSRSTPSTRTSRPPTSPSIRRSPSSASASSACCTQLPALGIDADVPPRRQQRGAAARRARLVRLRPPGPAALRHRAAAAGRDARAATCPVTAQPYRGGEGHCGRAKAPATACTSVERSPRTIAVVPAGYADGLDRRLAGRGYMLVRGRRAPVVGSVCMDMTMIDVTGIDVAPGDEVVIVGAAGRRGDRRARNRRVDRDDPVRAAVPRRHAD